MRYARYQPAMPAGSQVLRFATLGLGSLALGAAFGAATSLSNSLVSSSESDSFARVPSLVLDGGWAWAALAVIAGWLAGTPARAAGAGALALLAGTISYYVADSIIRDESLALYWPEMGRWWLASIVFGPVLGVVGAYARRPGPVGLLCALVVPVGAVVQMIVSPPGPGAVIANTPPEDWARIIVVTVAAVIAAAAVGRFALAPRRGRVGAPSD